MALFVVFERIYYTNLPKLILTDTDLGINFKSVQLYSLLPQILLFLQAYTILLNEV